jgi:hypothetical protein
MFHFHKWTKWEITAEGSGHGPFVGKVKILYQRRKCLKCGFVQESRQIN